MDSKAMDIKSIAERYYDAQTYLQRSHNNNKSDTPWKVIQKEVEAN